jgi:PiT family inorganic phosphate transporter
MVSATVFAGLMGAIVWDLLTWWWGLPTSSSHALVGGFVGAAVTKAGFGSLVTSGLTKILLFIVVSPTLD